MYTEGLILCALMHVLKQDVSKADPSHPLLAFGFYNYNPSSFD